MSHQARPKLTPHGRVRRSYWMRQLQVLPEFPPMAGGAGDTWLDEYHLSAPADAPEISPEKWQKLQEAMLANHPSDICESCEDGAHDICLQTWREKRMHASRGVRWYCQCSCRDEQQEV